MTAPLTARQIWWAQRDRYRLLKRSDRQWKPDPYLDQRGMYDGPPNEAGRFLLSLPEKVQQCLTGWYSPPTERQERILQCKRTPPHERTKEAAIAHGIAQMRAIDESRAEWKRLAELMKPTPPEPCTDCKPDALCWFHRNAWRMAA